MDQHNRDLSYWKNVRSKMRLQPFVNAVESSAVPIVISDPFEPDTPLVFVNEAFTRLTGYSEDEVLGRNCRFLQGPDTDPADRDAVRQALTDEATLTRQILNYRKDGSRFWNELHMAPMFDDRGELLYFIATQIDVTERVERQNVLSTALDAQTAELRDQAAQTHHMAREMTHRVRNSLALIQAMLRMQLSSLTDATARSALVGALSRIGAIVEIQRIIEHAELGEKVEVGQIITSICERLDHITHARVEAAADAVVIPEELVTPVALIVSELVTNAQKHAYANGETGTIQVSARREPAPGFLRLAVRDDGKGVPDDFDPRTVKGFGMRMLVREIDHLGATLAVDRLGAGTQFVVSIPAPTAAE